MEGYTTPVPLIDHLEVIDLAFIAAIRFELGISPVNQMFYRFAKVSD